MVLYCFVRVFGNEKLNIVVFYTVFNVGRVTVNILLNEYGKYCNMNRECIEIAHYPPLFLDKLRHYLPYFAKHLSSYRTDTYINQVVFADIKQSITHAFLF